MTGVPTHYTSPDEDSSRWIDFPFREGDIVISARSKSGTTWVQTICALLVFQTPDLPDSLSNLSPWLDWLITPPADVYAQLAGQDHRRFIKTHTPLDGLPVDPRVTYIVTGRHPLDMAVSLYHQGGNLNRERIRELTGQPDSRSTTDDRPPLHDGCSGGSNKMSIPRTRSTHYLACYGTSRMPGVVEPPRMSSLSTTTTSSARSMPEMRRLASRLGVSVSEETWSGLGRSGDIRSDAAEADSIAPDPSGILKDQAAFFRRGSSGEGSETLTRAELDHYYRRVSRMAPMNLFEWLHRHSWWVELTRSDGTRFIRRPPRSRLRSRTGLR